MITHTHTLSPFKGVIFSFKTNTATSADLLSSSLNTNAAFLALIIVVVEKKSELQFLMDIHSKSLREILSI